MPKSALVSLNEHMIGLAVSQMIKGKDLSKSADLDFVHLQSVLESNLFKCAPVLSGLLLYLWQNKDYGFSEYAIAVDALGRKPDFDSRTDATVRVQISRLRKLLGKYYESEGSLSPVRIIIPLGSHQVKLLQLPLEAPEISEDDLKLAPEGTAESEYSAPPALIISPQDASATPHRFLVPAMVVTIMLLLCWIGVLLWSPLHSRNQNPASTNSRLPAFWKTFSNNGKSLRLVLPAPTFFAWTLPGNSSFLVRDTSVNKFSQYDGSNEIAGIAKRLGKPSSWQGYATLSDAFAALQLVRFLDNYGIRTSISSSAESPQAILEHENIVAFGGATSLGDYQSDVEQLSYKLGPHEAYIIDKRLSPGSPVQFPAKSESAARSIKPGLVAFLPRGSSGSHLLILQGAQTSALISWLTSEEGLHEIDEAERTQGGGPYFEAVILSEVNGENPIQSRMVAFRPFFINGH